MFDQCPQFSPPWPPWPLWPFRLIKGFIKKIKAESTLLFTLSFLTALLWEGEESCICDQSLSLEVWPFPISPNFSGRFWQCGLDRGKGSTLCSWYNSKRLFIGKGAPTSCKWQTYGLIHIAFITAIMHGYIIYESLSDVGESRVWFASKYLTPCRMHWNALLIAQIIAKCHSFPNMYDIL